MRQAVAKGKHGILTIPGVEQCLWPVHSGVAPGCVWNRDVVTSESDWKHGTRGEFGNRARRRFHPNDSILAGAMAFRHTAAEEMKSSELKNSLADTVAAARAAGRLLRRNQWSVKRINSQSQHDIKLELDVRCQKLIERALLKRLPGSAVLGEEGVRGQPDAPWRWVIDPIDGTVNFAYGIPHACVSIALQ